MTEIFERKVIETLSKAELTAICNVQDCSKFENCALFPIGEITIMGEKNNNLEAYYTPVTELDMEGYRLVEHVSVEPKDYSVFDAEIIEWLAGYISDFFLVLTPTELDKNASPEKLKNAKEFARKYMLKKKIELSEGLEEAYAICYFTAIEKLEEMYKIVQKFFDAYISIISKAGYSKDIFVSGCDDEERECWITILSMYFTDDMDLLIDVNGE